MSKKNIKVLWVDDDANYLLSPLQRRLEQEGFQISTAADPQAAIELLRSEKYDILLVDVMLADPRSGRVVPSGGLDVVGNLQSTPNANTPLVGLSVVVFNELGKERERFTSYFDKTTLLEKGVLKRLIESLKHGGRVDEEFKEED